MQATALQAHEECHSGSALLTFFPLLLETTPRLMLIVKNMFIKFDSILKIKFIYYFIFHITNPVLQCYMVSGDNWTTARIVAEQLGVDNVMAEVLPAGKAAKVQHLSSGSQPQTWPLKKTWHPNREYIGGTNANLQESTAGRYLD